jgi:flagella basal body P-ring formation protein FlgA
VNLRLTAALVCLAAPALRAATDGVAPTAAALAEQALRTKLHESYPDVTQWDIDALPLTSAVTLASPQDELAATVIRLGVRSAVWVAPRVESGRKHGVMLWYSVAGYGPAIVASHRLAQGSALDARDGTHASSDLLAAGCAAVASPAGLDGMRARVTIGEGEVICSRAIEERPPVARGDEVTVRYLAGPVTLTARAVAQADGLLGRPVLVRSTGSGDFFKATVSGKAEVRVDD